jgi:hypothetical protein
LAEEPKQSSETLWTGKITIDDSFDDYAVSVQDFPDYKMITIQDVSHAHNGVGNIETNLGEFPIDSFAIIVVIRGKKITGSMDCKLFAQYLVTPYQVGVFRKKTEYSKRFLGYGIELSPSIEESEDLPRLASIKTKLGGDNYITIQDRGIFSLFSGSRSAETYDAARKSLTTIFLASKDKPFSATIREKGNNFNFKADSTGFIEKPVNFGKSKPKTENSKINPSDVLKMRLAKGEITKQEYDELKSVLEN